MVLGRFEHEVFGVEVDERVEEHVRGVRPELLRFPQVFLLDTTHQLACRGEERTHIRIVNIIQHITLVLQIKRDL